MFVISFLCVLAFVPAKSEYASIGIGAVDPTRFEFSEVIGLSPGEEMSKWRMADKDENRRWRNGTIPYQIAQLDFTDDEIKEMKRAMDVYMQETCLRFRQAEENDPYSIIIRDGGSGCNSVVGQINTKGAQSVNLAAGCRFYGLYLHELGHAIGLHHEHQHPDRHQGVSINIQNVYPNMREWFNTIDRKGLNMYDVAYDMQSIMHYEETAFAMFDANRMPMISIVARNPAHRRFLYNVYMKDLSFGDVKRVNLMYKCNKHCGNVNCNSRGFVNKYCQCETPENFARRRCVNAYSESECERRKGECTGEYGNKYDMFVNCRKTCDRCYKPI